MSILDEFDKKISDLSKNAVQKSKDMSESLKISSAIKDEENKINQLYTKLGREFYFQDKKITEKIIAICEQIDKSIATIQQLNYELLKLKKVVKCPNCDTENLDEAFFCLKCGTKLSTLHDVQSDKEKVCKKCGTKLLENQIYCTKCGTKYEESKQENKVSLKRICKKCGNKILENQIYCVNCGTKYVEVESLEKEWKIMPVDGVATCPKCGNKLKKGQKFCISCGYKLFYER